MHHSDIEERESDTGADSSFVIDEKSNRKFLFKKRSTSSTCAVSFNRSITRIICIPLIFIFCNI